jgi:Uma2 family endonuclease
MSSQVSRAGTALPDIDDRLVAPESRYEIHDGEIVYVSPADPPHGTRHVQIAALVEAHAGPAFEVAADMLTRTSEIDDIAPDVSVYPEAPHPEHGGRQLEELAFEVVSTSSLGDAGRKARKLVGRGVRRVFAIDVERSRALEWSAEQAIWRELEASGHIADPALAVALPVDAMIHAARTDDAVARALIVRRNPVIEAVRAGERAEGHAAGRAEGSAAGRAEGLAAGKAEALIAILAMRGLALDDATLGRVHGERDLARLERWIARAVGGATLTEVFAEP